MDASLPLLVAVPLLGAALLVAGGRLVPRPVAETVGCAVSAGTAALALVLLLNCSPPFLEWAGGWTPVEGQSVGIVLIGDGPGLGMAALASLLTLSALAYSWPTSTNRRAVTPVPSPRSCCSSRAACAGSRSRATCSTRSCGSS